MTARPTCALENVKDQHGDAGLRAVATFLHCMGSDGTLAWGEASWTPCDMVMQEAWEMGAAPITTDALKDSLDRQQAQNNKILHLLATMERLWPDDEKWLVQSLASQAEATRSVLRDCSERLEKLK